MVGLANRFLKWLNKNKVTLTDESLHLYIYLPNDTLWIDSGATIYKDFNDNSKIEISIRVTK